MSDSPTAPIARILVIDDETAVLRLVSLVLRRAGYHVKTADSGNEALEILAEASEPFDCVVTDAIMPGLDGYQLTRAIRATTLGVNLPIVMLTRKRQPQDVKNAIDAGVNDYVVKPIDEQLLVDKVGLVLRKGSGPRHVYECPLNGPIAEARIELQSRIIAVSESSLTLRLPVALTDTSPFVFECSLFREIDIPAPMLKLLRCEPAEPLFGPQDPLVFEAKLAFVGTPEPSLKKIRAWLQRQALQRRK